MDNKLKSNITSGRHWLRLVFMLLFAIILYVAMLLMWVLVALQFLFSLVTGRDNIQLRGFGEALSIFIYQMLRFLTYNSEEKPFPFADWPQPEQNYSGTADDRPDEVEAREQPLPGEPENPEPEAGQKQKKEQESGDQGPKPSERNDSGSS
jgi:hypothetical protein